MMERQKNVKDSSKKEQEKVARTIQLAKKNEKIENRTGQPQISELIFTSKY